MIVVEPRSRLRRLGIREVWEYRYLLWFFALRTIRGRYRPTLLGRGWILLRPALLCLVYVGVFGVLLDVRTDPVPFSLFVFTGVIVFQFFSAGITDMAASLVSNHSIMSKVYYPRLVVPLASAAVNSVDFGITMLIVAVMMAIYRVEPPWPALLFTPALLLAIALMTLAVGLVLAAVTVRVRDVLMALPVLMRVFIYTMPVVYPTTLIPEPYRPLYYLNPMSVYLQGLRSSLMGDIAPPTWSLVLATFVTLATLGCGLYAFSRVERTMVDVL